MASAGYTGVRRLLSLGVTSMIEQSTVTRRRLLQMAGGAGVLALAGCTGATNANTKSTTTTTDTSMTDTTNGGQLLQTVQLSVMAEARAGPDGNLHDTFAPGSFTIAKGIPTAIEVFNYDGGRHTLTAPDLDLDIDVLSSAKAGVPNVTTHLFTPTKTGDFTWSCEIPCDGEANGWAMQHDGYMKGTIHVTEDASTQHAYTAIKDGYKAGPKGHLHDSFLATNFTVSKGVPVKLHVENFDEGPHSFSSKDLGVDVDIPKANGEGDPSETVVSFSPKQEGTFHWDCDVPCDDKYNGWAMQHDGFMAGEVNVI